MAQRQRACGRQRGDSREGREKSMSWWDMRLVVVRPRNSGSQAAVSGEDAMNPVPFAVLQC